MHNKTIIVRIKNKSECNKIILKLYSVFHKNVQYFFRQKNNWNSNFTANKQFSNLKISLQHH